MLRERLYGPYARATAHWRVLPNFLIIGAKRCGTTHLFNTLRHHPQIKLSRYKETAYFAKDEMYEKGELFYRSHFPLNLFVSPDTMVGEATPGYLAHPKAAIRIKQDLPNAKLIVMLRDPTERFISSYYYGQQKYKNRGKQWPSVAEYLENTKDWSQLSGIREGMYATNLAQYVYFKERGQLLVIKSEDYFNSREYMLEKICDFLDIESFSSFPELENKNQSVKKNKTEDEHARMILDEYFRTPNVELEHEWGVAW